MKKLMASIAALGLIASPAFAASSSTTKTMTTKAANARATTTVTTRVTPVAAKGTVHARVKRHSRVTHSRAATAQAAHKPVKPTAPATPKRG
jgi:hypothetical protein